MKDNFLTFNQTLTLMIRTCLISGEMTPKILHEATGVDMESCIDFLSKCFGEFTCAKPPKISR